MLDSTRYSYYVPQARRPFYYGPDYTEAHLPTEVLEARKSILKLNDGAGSVNAICLTPNDWLASYHAVSKPGWKPLDIQHRLNGTIEFSDKTIKDSIKPELYIGRPSTTDPFRNLAVRSYVKAADPTNDLTLAKSIWPPREDAKPVELNPVADWEDKIGKPVYIVGYPKEKTTLHFITGKLVNHHENLSLDKSERLNYGPKSFLQIDTAFPKDRKPPGISGGGVFSIDRSGKLQFLGQVFAGIIQDKKNYNFGRETLLAVDVNAISRFCQRIASLLT